MKKFLNISIISFTFLIAINLCIKAQFHCTVGNKPNSKSTHIIISTISLANVSTLKTIRVIVHFPLRTNRTGNFTETTDYYGVVNQYTGYWLADKFIERSNAWLNSNQQMTQQLSYKPPIPVNSINLQFKLVGVVFHNDDILYNTGNLSTMNNYIDVNNHDVCINVFLYPGASGNGAAWYGDDIIWINGTQSAYDDYLNYGQWGIDHALALPATHEIGHCLQLPHPKMSDGGVCCTSNSPSCLDNCDDTPTYLELLNDGYTDPCIWSGPGYSNNVMDYGPFNDAWTPCQIEIIHTEIENNRTMMYPCGYITDALNVVTNISTINKVYVAKNITVNNVTVSETKALYINSETFETTGTFEIKLGAIFDLSTAPKCN
jgi:hypothetical protein